MKKENNLIFTIKVLSVFVVLLVFTLVVVLINNHDKNQVEETTKKTVLAKVLETYDDFLLVEDEDTNKKYTISTKDKYNEGDYIYVTYSKDIEKPDNIEVIITNKETKDKMVVEDEVTTATTSKTNVNNEKKEVAPTRTTKTTVFQENKSIDEIVVDYAKKAKDTIDTYVLNDTNKEKAKTSFCTLVDFIFYDGNIKGHTFKELSASAKAKVIYYTLLIDGELDEKWPGYKDTINSKYNDVKLKLVAKYLEICDYVRENQPELYENLKSDFALLKKSVSITWDFVKSALTSAGKFTTSKLKNWYETFRG